jgi:predicted flavoprotein YhiN
MGPARRFDVIVIGGGAAGLMCAIEAGRRGRRVCVL